MRRQPNLIPVSLNGDLRRGGYVLQGRVEGDTDAVQKGDNWRLMGKSGAQFVDPEWRMFFNGHVTETPDNIQVDRYGSSVDVMAGTMDVLISGESIQDIGFTSQASPANDHQINNMVMGHMIDHIIRRHCNAVYSASTMPDGVITELSAEIANSIPLARYNVSKSDNMWRTLQSIGGGEESGEFARCWFDRRNKFYYDFAPPFWDTPPTSKGTITKDHLKGLIRIRRNANKPGERVGQVSITAIKDFETIYTAKYPANPADGKILPPRDGIWADSQATADTQAQRLYQWLTRAYTLEIQLDPGLVLFGDDGFGLDLANKVTLTYDGPVEDAISGAGLHIDFTDQDFFIYGVNVRFDVHGRAAGASLILEQDPT